MAKAYDLKEHTLDASHTNHVVAYGYLKEASEKQKTGQYIELLSLGVKLRYETPRSDQTYLISWLTLERSKVNPIPDAFERMEIKARGC